MVALVVVLTAFALLRSRRRTPGDAAPAEGRAENDGLEAAYVVLLCVVTAGLVTASFVSFDKVGAKTSAPAALGVAVDAAKWRWRFAYPGGTSSIGLLVVPEDRPVRFAARSADVLHDFWVPSARFQEQVWPDRTTRWTLTFPHGTYDGVCAWFCGLRHDQMRFTVRAVPAAEFRRWLASRRGTGGP